jgi:glutaredoxin 3
MELQMALVEIYTKWTCPFCARAKALLAKKGAPFEEFEISMDREKRSEMIDRSGGRTTVPQVFINGQHIGGSDDLAAIDSKGELDALLAA